MNTARRWYIYLVCAISLQSVTWAVIALLRNLFAGGSGSIAFIAFQIAVILIALPVFLVHWLWGQRLAQRDANEREAGLRGIYHYSMLIGFLGPVIANTFSLITFLFWLVLGSPGYDASYDEFSGVGGIIYHLVAIIFCSSLWLYQKQVISNDLKSDNEPDGFGTMRRLYMFVFSAWGVTMTTMAVIHLIRWVMLQFGENSYLLDGNLLYVTDEVTRLIVGVPLWFIFWRQAQTLFLLDEPSEAERDSALRKFYLYTTVFVAALTVVTNATIILAGFFRRILDLPSAGDIRVPLPTIIGMALLWIYHSYALKEDAARSPESAKQGGVRRLYLYLIAAVGLTAFLIGLSGDINVVIRSFSTTFFIDEGIKEALAWFTAALISGLPVWLLPWRWAQVESVALSPEGSEARRSTARKIYLYFFLFIATMTVLSSAVYIVYRLLALMLGEPGEGNLLTGIANAIAYSIVGIFVWLYHGLALRGDGESSRREQALRLKDIRVALVADDKTFGQSLLKQLQRDEPDLNFETIFLPPENNEAKNAAIAKLNGAGMIVGPWFIAVEGGSVDSQIAKAVAQSPARKILIPVNKNGWDWAGVDRWNTEALIQQTARAVKQWIDGDEVKAVHPMTVGGIIATVIGVFLLLLLLLIPLSFFF